MYVYACLNVWGRHVYICGDQKLLSGDFLNHFPLYLLRKGLSLHWELSDLASLAWLPAYPDTLSPPLSLEL